MKKQDSTSSSSGNKPWPQYRSKHRQRSHDQAHADQAGDEAPGNFDHSLVCSSPAEIINSATQLSDFAAHVRQTGSFGYDSEFIGEHSYYPQLCVIQAATPHRIAIIDPLEGLDLRPFWELVADARIETIVHAGQPDLEPVIRHLSTPPQHVFDTQIAAAFAGLSYPMALAKLLHAFTDRELIRSSRNLKFSQWDRRPLSDAQLRYAAEDVRYLPLLRQLLRERLVQAGNLPIAEEECRSLSDPSLYAVDADSQRLRVRGFETLNPTQRHVVRALLAWREDKAREHDVPPRTLLRDDVMYELATATFAAEADLARVPGLPRPLQREYGAAVVKLICEAASAPVSSEEDESSNRGFSKAEREQRRAGILKAWQAICDHCERRAIFPGIVTSKRELDRLFRAIELNADCRACKILRGWRREFLQPILPSLHPELKRWINS